MLRRQALRSLAGVAAALAAPTALFAQDYPVRPIRLIVPFQAGSTPDLWARSVGSLMRTRLGQPWVVENVPGAGGSIGAAAVKRAAADGYTLGLFANTQAITAHTFSSPPYVLSQDFIAITGLSSGESLLTVPASSPVQSARDLIDTLKAKPGEVAYGSGGNGSIAHLAVEQLLQQTGTRALHVPYKGALDIVTSQLSGQTAFGMPILGTAANFVKSGKLRGLAVTSRKRSPLLPDVPTLHEALPPGFELVSWSGLFAPAKTPKPIIARLFEEIDAVVRSGALEELAAGMGGSVAVYDSQAQFQAFVDSEDKRFRDLVTSVGVKVDGR